MLQSGHSALWKASYDGHRDIILLLFQHNAEVDLPNNVRYTVTLRTQYTTYTVHIGTIINSYDIVIHSMMPVMTSLVADL